MLIENEDGQLMLFVQDMPSGKMSLDRSHAQMETISRQSSSRLSRLKNHTLMCLDQRPGAGNMLGFCWEYDPPWLMQLGRLNTSECPRDVEESFLWQILQDTVPYRYYLTKVACKGILRRSKERGKPLPIELERALLVQAGLAPVDILYLPKPIAFAANQRDEVRDLNNIAGALGAQPGMKQQTFIAEGTIPPTNSENNEKVRESATFTAAFSAGAGSSAGSIAYSEDCAPTLRGTASGNMMPSVLCINDQGGQRMDFSEAVSGTLRSQDHGHPPLVMPSQKVEIPMQDNHSTEPESESTPQRNQQMLFDNHGIDSRYTGPHDVAPTLTSRAGTGGNNLPIVGNAEPVFCITGNAIDRKPRNGGNGIGYQEDIAYTLTTCDHHAVYSRQRVDVFREDDIASTESARQYKDATDLVRRTDPIEVADDDNAPSVLLIRRLTPVECERLQGLKDDYTNVPGASDAARYRAIGNGVAIPCVEYLMRGIALAAAHPERVWSF